jgi:pimeloyl-ACP methyl ester carboxylesterase
LKTRFLIGLLLLWIGYGSSLSASAQASSFTFQQQPGPYPVGLKVIDQYDHSRSFPESLSQSSPPSSENAGRPLQTLVWYPSEKTASPAMTVGDYTELADTELRFTAPDPEHNKWRTRLKTAFGISLRAVRNAKPADGRFPVVIYAASDSSISWENADLCEYLASYGYVVLASPSLGVSTRDMTDDVPGINAQASDISFLITYSATLPDADVSKVAVASFSWGGISSLFAAARDPRIVALVQLDGSMRYFPGLIKQAGDIHPDKLTIPLLFFTSVDPNFIEDMDSYYDGPPGDIVGPDALNAWKHGDLLTINMMGMSHPEFSSMFQRRKTAGTFAEDEVADYGREDTNTSYAWVARYTLEFLNAYLKHDASAKTFLLRTPTQNGVPMHFMGMKFRPAQAATPAQH